MYMYIVALCYMYMCFAWKFGNLPFTQVDHGTTLYVHVTVTLSQVHVWPQKSKWAANHSIIGKTNICCACSSILVTSQIYAIL